MANTYTQIYVHAVFAVQERACLIRKEWREELFKYICGIFKNKRIKRIAIGGVEDHVHILCRLSKTLDVSTLVRELKRDSSKWIKEQDSQLGDFYWQQGYGAFSISPSHVEPLIQYISNQDQHHLGESFQDEYRRLCKHYGVAIDERYVWD